ncbi:MAG: hypothetical protein ACI4CC_06980, partial [Lachnospiraceae bacterium]
TNKLYKTLVEEVTVKVPEKEEPVVEPTKATLTATGVKELKVEFDNPVDTTVATLTITKGTAQPTTTVTWSEDKKTATVTMGGKITEGTYTATLTGYKNEITASVATKDETVTGFEIAENLIAVTSGTAQVRYYVLNQYGEYMTPAHDPSVNTSFGTTSFSQSASATRVGIIDVTISINMLEIEGTTGTIVLVDKDNGASTTKTIKYSAKSTATELTVEGLFNTSKQAFQDMTAGEDASTYQLLFTAVDQYGNTLDADDLKSSGKSPLTFTVIGGLTNLAYTADALKNVTINGKDYIAATFNSATLAAGTATITIVNPNAGLLYSNNFQVAYGKTVKSVNISLKNSVYNKEKNELSYEVIDTEGNPITSYKELDSLVKFDLGTQAGAIDWKKKTDGTAALIFTPAYTGWKYSENKKESTIYSISTTANYNVTEKFVINSFQFTINEERELVAVAGILSSTPTSLGATDKSTKVYADYIIYEDQYSNRVDSSDVSSVAVASFDTLFSTGVANLNVAIEDTTNYALDTAKLASKDDYGYYYTIYPTDPTYVGSTAVYLRYGAAASSANYDYKYSHSTVVTTNSGAVSNLKVAYVAYGYQIAATTNVPVTADDLWGIKIVGAINGANTTIPSSQWAIESVTAPAITTADVLKGETTKTGTVNFVVSTYDTNGNEVTNEVSAEFEYSVDDAKIVEVSSVNPTTFTAETPLELTSVDLLKSFTYTDQYGNTYAYDENAKNVDDADDDGESEELGWYLDYSYPNDGGYGKYNADDVLVADAEMNRLFSSVKFTVAVTDADTLATNVKTVKTVKSGTKDIVVTFVAADTYTVETTIIVNGVEEVSVQKYTITE